MFGNLDEVPNIGFNNLVPGGESNTFSDGGNEKTRLDKNKISRLPPSTDQLDVRMSWQKSNLATPKTGRGANTKVNLDSEYF